MKPYFHLRSDMKWESFEVHTVVYTHLKRE